MKFKLYDKYAVSIPYRDDKNLISRQRKDKTKKFQSLIGTIKTITQSSDVIQHIDMFQSLIGTIKTQEAICTLCLRVSVSIPYRDDKNVNIANDTLIIEYVFQSLIGTIKTHRYEEPHYNWYIVSIPYRDDKNSLSKLKSFVEITCFNPL